MALKTTDQQRISGFLKGLTFEIFESEGLKNYRALGHNGAAQPRITNSSYCVRFVLPTDDKVLLQQQLIDHAPDSTEEAMNMQQHCSSESRAFFIIDSLTDGCWVWAQKALLRLGSTLAVALKQPAPLGVAVLHRSKPGQATQLQILLRLGATFQAREYLACIKRLSSASAGPDASASDGNMISSALVALMQHMQKLPARPNCRNHLFVLSSSFAACVNNAKVQKVLQLVSLQPGYSIHFLQLTGPEAELQAEPAIGTSAVPVQHPGASSSDASATAFHQMLRSMDSCSNVTYDALVADCEVATDLMCQSWLRELLTSHQCSSTSRSDNSTSPHSPDLLLHFGGQTLPCSVQQHILQLDPWLLPAHLCPCHHLPMQPCNSSTAAAAHAAASAASSDAGSMAALLMLPEVTPWSCSVTGQAVGTPLSSCPVDARILQLGRHTQLTMPTAAPAAAAAATDGQGGGMVQRRLGMLQALPMPLTQPSELTVQHKLAPSAIDSMLLYGMPMLLCPSAGSSRPSAPTAAAPSLQDAAGLLGLGTRDQGVYQQDTSQQQQQGQGASAADAVMLMRALCQLLLEEQQVLVAHSNHDLLRRIHMPLQQWYMLQPAADGSSLLLRWVASREQLLTPLARDSNGLGSCIGGSAAAAAALHESLADQVVLLDAEQLESVRASLARLDGLNPGGSGSARQAVGAVSTGAEGQVTAACLDSEASVPSTSDLEGLGSGQPLLLSCGLDAWVSAVLESSTATYIPQAAGPVAAPGRAPAGAAGHSASAGQVMQDMRHPQAPTTAQTAGHGCTPQPPAHTVPPVMQQPVEQGSKQCGMDASSAGHGRAGGPGCAGSSMMPPIPSAGQSSHQQCQMYSAQQQQQQQQRQQVVPEAGMVSAGVSAGDAAPAAPGGRVAGGRGGRGRRNSSSGTAAGRKLKLSKV